ncbi:hypothetical protein AAEO50_19310 [Rossellomorea oryzaecorticis]|uniref:Uncharacterized protein n=1 Tax=Rossellomorea oryzaecorticis TaxID=1396505 RepID=A0ABU9KEI1_9BACI
MRKKLFSGFLSFFIACFYLGMEEVHAWLELHKLVNNVDEVKRNDTKTGQAVKHLSAYGHLDTIREINAAPIIPDGIVLEA